MPCSINWYILINYIVPTKGKMYHLLLIIFCNCFIQFVAIANDLKKAKQEARLQRTLTTKQLYFQKCEEVNQLKSSILKVSSMIIYIYQKLYSTCMYMSLRHTLKIS